MRFEVDITHRCNLSCKWCSHLVGYLSIPDSDISLEDLEAAGDVLRRTRTRVDMIRICGGEPLMHPQLREICKAIENEWKPQKKIKIYTNGMLSRAHLRGLKIQWSFSPPNVKRHKPFMVSPSDIGIDVEEEYKNPCHAQRVCGRAFDSFGFTFCPFAGVIGRVVGIDPYRSKPTSERMFSICRHCMFIVRSKEKRTVLENKARKEVVDCPSETYREGLARNKKEPMEVKRFLERL